MSATAWRLAGLRQNAQLLAACGARWRWGLQRAACSSESDSLTIMRLATGRGADWSAAAHADGSGVRWDERA
eukprot:scaffold238833_cov35-Tisochrysis_lutea.AAC.1